MDQSRYLTTQPWEIPEAAGVHTLRTVCLPALDAQERCTLQFHGSDGSIMALDGTGTIEKLFTLNHPTSPLPPHQRLQIPYIPNHQTGHFPAGGRKSIGASSFFQSLPSSMGIFSWLVRPGWGDIFLRDAESK